MILIASTCFQIPLIRMNYKRIIECQFVWKLHLRKRFQKIISVVYFLLPLLQNQSGGRMINPIGTGVSDERVSPGFFFYPPC